MGLHHTRCMLIAERTASFLSH